MTTIACDGLSMAADGLCVDHTDMVVERSLAKIRRLADGRICGGAGSSFDFDSWTHWLTDGKPDEAPMTDNTFCGLILHPDGRLLWVDHKGRELPQSVPAAIGSGAVFAMGAMYAGASAKKAVEIATLLDVHSGGTVREEKLE